MRSFLCLRCLATPMTCVPRPRAAASMSWSLPHYIEVPKSIAEKIISTRTKKTNSVFWACFLAHTCYNTNCSAILKRKLFFT